jgi:hypothetical protein
MPERCSNTLGRGESAMNATLSPQVTTSEPTLATLREVLADAKATDLPDRAYLWDRAAALLVSREITPGVEHGWYIEAKDRSRLYWVCQVPSGRWFCTCPDAERRGVPCKHTRAIDLWQRTVARSAADDGLTAFPARTLPDDAPIPFELSEAALAALDAPAPVA